MSNKDSERLSLLYWCQLKARSINKNIGLADYTHEQMKSDCAELVDRLLSIPAVGPN